ncbi:phage tail assembly protein T [Acinetobacter sp. NigerLNRRAM0016]
MSARELDMWQAFNYFEPIGISREDALAANIAYTIARSQGVSDISLSEFMLFRNIPELIDADSEELDQGATKAEIEDMCVNMKAMFSKVV